MANKISIISIAFVLLCMVCISTQKKTRAQAKCDRLEKKVKKSKCSFNVPVDGVWEEWIETSTCTVTCGGGTKAFSRKCTEPQHGGKACEGDQSRIDRCEEQKCPVTLKDVVREVSIPWNPDTQSITITTDSVAGSADVMRVGFYDKYNAAGSLWIAFATQIQYKIGWCTDFNPFPVTVPTETQKTWTIAYNYAERRVVLKCNEMQVLDVVVSDSVCTKGYWSDTWVRKPTQIKFTSSDHASDSYSLSTGAI